MAPKNNTAKAVSEVAWDSETIKAALESGKVEDLQAVLKVGYDARVMSINPQVQKELAKVILELAEYEVPEKIRKSTNNAVTRLEELKKTLKASGNLTEEVEKVIDQQIAEASTAFVASDGIQKGWQAFVEETIAYWFEHEKENQAVADTIRGCISEIVEYGAKRPMNKSEKAAYEKDKSTTSGNGKKDEEPEEEKAPEE